MDYKSSPFYPFIKSSWILFAAKQPSAADIIVCLNLFELVVTSPAAYNHSKLVSCLASTTKQPSSSFLNQNLKLNQH